MDKRKTRQREIILEIIKNDRSHPTIKELYQKVKMVDQTIGQATIYRNVSRLCEEGILKKISIDVDYYDYIVTPHYHLYCKRCHQLYDIFDESDFDKKKLAKKNHIQIDSMTLFFKGVCRECLDEEVPMHDL